MAKIEVRGVQKSYRAADGQEVPAVENVHLAVKEGEFVGLVGPSGCGKSTLLYTIAGFLSPTAGLVLVDGRPVTGPGTDRGIVFQEYALFPWRTVRENIQFGLEYQSLSPGERAARARHCIAF